MNTPDSDDWMRIADRIVNDARRALEVIIALALVGCIGAALFGTPRADAQTACSVKPACNPRDQPDRTQCGPLLKGQTAAGQWEGYWWLGAKSPTVWTWCKAQWAMLDKYAAKDPRTVMTIANAVMDGPDLIGRIQEAMATYSIKPPAGSQDEFDFLSLHYAACQALAVSPPGALGWTPGLEPKCTAPTPPAPPPPPTVAYVVTGSQAFPLNPSGARSIVPISEKPILGSTCDCVTKEIIQYGARFCAVTIPNVTQLVVAGCSVKK